MNFIFWVLQGDGLTTGSLAAEEGPDTVKGVLRE